MFSLPLPFRNFAVNAVIVLLVVSFHNRDNPKGVGNKHFEMKQILHCDWLPERAKWRYHTRSGLNCKAPFPESNKIFPVKVAGYWPRSFFCELMDLDSVGCLGQHPAIFTSSSVNNSYVQDKQNAVLCYLQQSKQLVLDELTPNQSKPWYHSPLSTSLGACYEWTKTPHI